MPVPLVAVVDDVRIEARPVRIDTTVKTRLGFYDIGTEESYARQGFGPDAQRAEAHLATVDASDEELGGLIGLLGAALKLRVAKQVDVDRDVFLTGRPDPTPQERFQAQNGKLSEPRWPNTGGEHNLAQP